MSIVIKIENVSKQYRLGSIGTNTLKGDIQSWWYKLQGLPDPTLKIGLENNLRTKAEVKVKGLSTSTLTSKDFIWALKNINLEVKQGEVLGIIGKNGAGKSTLLKLLSRVTAPTNGEIKIKGRIASLLEVGTGFHPDLTGRENIFLNGAILGMTKTEIQSKLEEIVDFAGIAKYIDTPVKRYSSGMYVRLAFAVAANLESEILIVDEVLSVGDAEFQKSALGKMRDVSKGGGRTVLFVSHNMASINTLTNTSICLANGQIVSKGKTSDVINYYLNDSITFRNVYNNEPNLERPNFTRIEIKTSEPNYSHKNGQDLIIHFEVSMPYELKGMAVSFQILSRNEIPIIFAYIFDSQTPILRGAGIHKLECVIPKCKLYQESYYLRAHLAESKGRTKFEEIDKICPFEIVMLGGTIEWGWQKNVCVYTESFNWNLFD
jgi:lipopolysaccharide transport system ATP-binding protein